MGRGALTPEIQALARDFLGREISTTELRLYAYLDYIMKNAHKIEPNKCNQDDRDVLRALRGAGHIEGGASGLGMTREFYDFVQAVLWEGYVAYDE